MPLYLASSVLKLAARASLLSVCFLLGVLFAPSANAQSCPGGTIGSCAVGFTLRATVTHYNPDGSVFGVTDDVRYESVGGSYRHVSVNSVFTREYSHQAGRGFFMVDHKRQLLLKSPIVGPRRNTLIGSSPQELRASQKFVRTQQLFGYTAYVQQFRDPETGVMFHEGWTIPELGVGFVKFNSYDRVTGTLVETFEPTSIVLGEPDPTNLRLPNYPEKMSPAPYLPKSS